MKLIKLYIAILILTITASACSVKNESVNNDKTMDLKTEIDSVSYGIGVNIGKNLAGQGMESLNPQAIAEALNDVLSGGELKIKEEECMYENNGMPFAKFAMFLISLDEIEFGYIRIYKIIKYTKIL